MVWQRPAPKFFGILDPHYLQIAPVGAIGTMGKIGIAGAIGGAGLLGGLMLGGGKKEQKIAQSQELEQEMGGTIIYPKGFYAPSPTYQMDFVTMIESPHAQVTTKKEATVTPTFTISPTQQAGQSQEATQQQGMDIMGIAVVAVIGVIAYALLVKKKGGKKK